MWTNIYIITAWIDMLEEIIPRILSLAVINVRGRLHNLVILRNISGPGTGAQVAVAVSTTAAKNIVLVLLLSLNCGRLINHLEVM